MNLMLIDKAIKGYLPSLDEGDKARLALFRSLWQIVDDASKAAPEYQAPEAGLAQTAARLGDAVLASYPATIDKQLLAYTLEKLVAEALQQGAFSADMCKALGSISWSGIMDSLDVQLAGKDPWAFLDSLAELLVKSEVDQTSARLAASMAFLAVRAQLEKPAAAIVAAIGKDDMEQGRFMKCPVCGSDPMVARVGGENATDGRGKVLGCLQCGTSWDFQRIRCARCGTQHQGHLHYFNLEGDDAHRINTCDECGGYMRTVFLDQALAPFSFEVEDVLMAKLDAVAANPSLAKGKAE